MGLTNADITALPDFTDAELLKLARHNIAKIMAGGQAYGIDGRNLTNADLPKLWETVAILEARVNQADGTGGIALASF